MRIRILTFILAVGALFVGCFSTYRLGSSDELNQAIGQNSAMVTLVNGFRYEANQIYAAGDSIRFLAADTVRQFTVKNIRSIETTSSGHGALEGLGLGTLIGGATGYALGASHSGGFIVSEKTASIVAGVLLGAATGAVAGLIRKHRDTYEFASDSLTTVRQH